MDAVGGSKIGNDYIRRMKEAGVGVVICGAISDDPAAPPRSRHPV
jgi:hypothetical protein